MRRKRRSSVRIALALAASLVVTAAGLLAADGLRSSPAEEPLPPSPRPAFAPENVPLGSRPTAQWAPVLTATTARRRPGAADVAATVPVRTPEGTTNIVLVLGQAVRRAARLWVHVRVAGVSEDVRGWVPRTALGGYSPVRTRLRVDRLKRRAVLFREGRPVFRAAVGVGAPATPTPSGDFYVRNKLHRYHSPFYGPVAFGTSARSATASDWPAGGFVGIHGTNRPDLIPGDISAGCIRMTNRDIRRLARLMTVGTPVIVQ
jgi:hypothetical protein